MRYVILLISLTLIGYLSYIGGYTVRSKEVIEGHETCLRKQSFIRESEICQFYGLRTQCKGLRPRYTYTYASHRMYACLYGRTGKAWGGSL